MILYKNVDICDLKSIMQDGILSMDECGNDNWTGERAPNDTSVVYLFNPIKKQNSFPYFGVALLEVETDAKENKMLGNDTHRNDYEEYIADKVSPEEIKRVIIPEVFKPYVDIPEGIPVCRCGLKADYYNEEDDLKNADNYILEQFSKTAPLMDSTWYNFFVGKNEDGTALFLYNVQYIF